jgi:hypothetical protein
MSISDIEYQLTLDRRALVMVETARGEDQEVAIPRSLAKVLQYYLGIFLADYPLERTQLHDGIEGASELLANRVGEFSELNLAAENY